MAVSTASNKCSPENGEPSAEPDAHKSKERVVFLTGIIRSFPIPQFAIDRNHQVILWNRALEEFSGIRAADIIGTNQQWRAFYNNERPCLADIVVDGAIEEQLSSWYHRKYSKSKFADDTYEVTDFSPMMGSEGIWLHFTATAIRNEKGEVIGAVETLEDISIRRQQEKQQTECNGILRKGNWELTDDLIRSLQEKETVLQNIDYRIKNNRHNIASHHSHMSICITARKKSDEEMKRIVISQIEHNMEQFLILIDQIRNPLQAILFCLDLDGAESRQKIEEQVCSINDIISKLDKGWLESNKVRSFLQRHYDIDKNLLLGL